MTTKTYNGKTYRPCSFMATWFHTDGTHTSEFFDSWALGIEDAKAQIDEIYTEPCTIYGFQFKD